ncbi:MAG TPA: XRE family transcriptional regulator [Chthoniobacteraceae bacterium]|nr:XRE family transcriptional regulator [Chthoniobacteraceae bacterium]
MDEKTIGANIRAIRQAAKVTLTEVATRAGITKSTLSKIETGQISTPISTLLTIASTLGVRLADFVREENPEKRWTFTPKGKGRLLVRNGSRFGYAYEGLAVDFPDRLVEPFLLTINPSDQAGVFRHEGHEFVYMLSGHVEFTVGSERFEMKEGDFLYFDSTLEHQTRLIGAEPARFLCCFIEQRN